MENLNQSVQTSELAVSVTIPGLPRELLYSVPAEFSEQATVGSEALVPISSREVRAWVTETLPLEEAQNLAKLEAKAHKKSANTSQLSLFEFDQDSPLLLRPVIEIFPCFKADDLKLFAWMSDYYGAPLADVIETAIPKRQLGREELFATIRVKSELETLAKRAPLQAKILKTLEEAQKPLPLKELSNLAPSARNAIRSLEKKGFLEVYTPSFSERCKLLPRVNRHKKSIPQQINTRQQSALNEIHQAIDSQSFKSFLLFGVTGSGKTEVYLQAIQHTLELGASALVIVPEISLTPQLIDHFQERLNVPIALLHSQVGAAARWDSWSACLAGEARVSIGARSAVFTPLQNLRLIVVDEEHETSYKQSDKLRYHARDVALMRAKLHNASIVLGSATPSFESLLNAKRKRYQLLEMPERATTRPVPKVEVVNLKKTKRKDMPSASVSPELDQAIKDTLSNKQQVIILYNRRGFSSYLQCETCNEVVMCPNCSVALTYHQHKGRLFCHYCDLRLIPPTHCRFCRDPRTTSAEIDADESVGQLAHRGGGTERIVEELAALYPDACIARMDRDTVTHKDSYRRILGEMRSGQTDILVGTQMIAKGHDLPGVTLVGIVDADVGLHLPDFRASEKCFQLITQAAGRAGRGEVPGRVLVQTRHPDHPTIVATASGRFKAFAKYELNYREKLEYPPIGSLLRLVVSSTEKDHALQSGILLKDFLNSYIQETNAPIKILGPAVAAHEKLKSRFRFHMLVKSSSRKAISEVARTLYQWKQTVKGIDDFRLAIDVDPVDML